MQNKIILTAFAFVIAAGSAFAQSTRDVGAPAPPQAEYQAQKKVKNGFLHRVFRKKASDPYYDKFTQQMATVRKQRRREARLAEKPQYSDPTYFGHKKPPKRRPLGKRKLCKECLIKH